MMAAMAPPPSPTPSSLPHRIRVLGSLVSAVLLFLAGGVMVVLGFAHHDHDPSYWFFAVVLVGVGAATLLLPAVAGRGGRERGRGQDGWGGSGPY